MVYLLSDFHVFNHPCIHLANFIIALGFGETGVTTTQTRIIRFSQSVGGVWGGAETRIQKYCNELLFVLTDYFR